MKAFLTSSFVFIFFTVLSPVYPQSSSSPYAQLVTSIDTHWVAKNHSAILQIIDDRLNSNSNDAFGLLLKRHYYIYAECDLPKARSAIDKINNIVTPLGDSSLTMLVSGLKSETDEIPLSESTPFSQTEIDAIHSIFPKRFPCIELCEAIANQVDSATANP